MRFSLSSWDLKRVAEELSPLRGSHLSQIYYNEGVLRLKISALSGELPETFRGEGKYSRLYLIFELPAALFLVPPRELPPSPPPTSFAMALRKHLSGSSIEGVEQVGGDRILKLIFRRGEERRELIVEMFSRGNVILTGEDRIELLLRREEFASRKLLPSLQYTPPPPPIPLQVLEREGVGETLREAVVGSGRRAIAAALVKELSLPPPIAREVLHRAGVDQRTPAVEAAERWDDIKHFVEEVVREQSGGGCYLYWLDEEVLISPVELKHLGVEGERCPSYLEGLLKVYRELRGEDERAEEVVEAEGRLGRRLKMQREALERLEGEAKRYAELAECVYRHYGELQGVVNAFEGGGEDLSALKGPGGGAVRILDPEKKVVAVSVKDPSLGEVEIELPLLKGVNGAAQSYYERAKTAKKKMEGLRKAMSDTERLLKKSEKTEAVERERWRPRRSFWFDPYRWFITSRGKIVVAGRDAKSNERVVKRYLKDGDIYLHADVQGASSVVLKAGEEAEEEEIREAAQFAVINSKAWKSGHAFGRAYWVHPYQVSKTPPSGEFLPRGSFVIRGKKNFVDHLPLRCAAGPVEMEGDRRFVCGPVEAVKAHSPWYVVLEPGNTPRKKVLGALLKLSGLPVEYIEPQLPPGNFNIVEVHGGKEVKEAFMGLNSSEEA